jgi:excisionase family DNA binding protein
MELQKFFRPLEVAELTGLAVATIRKKVLLRQLGYAKSGRAILIPASEVARLVGEYRPPVLAGGDRG